MCNNIGSKALFDMLVRAVRRDHHIRKGVTPNFADFQGIRAILSFLTGAVVEYSKIVKIHLVAILIYSVYFNATKKPLERARSLKRNMGAPFPRDGMSGHTTW